MSMQKPKVFIVMAMSADGKIATSNRKIQTFGSSEDEKRLLNLRATADAVMSGSNTINTASYDLGPGGEYYQKLRTERGLQEFNIRIIVSGSGNVNPDAEVFKHKFSPIIILTTQRCPPNKLETLKTLTPYVKVCGEKFIYWENTFHYLSSEWGIKTIACEGGGTLNDEIISQGWASELYLTITPIIVGGQKAPTICDGLGISKLNSAKAFHLTKIDSNKNEVFLDFIKEA